MMNYARIQMKTWIAIKNEHTANVQRRWDNRGNMYKAFQRCKKRAWPEYDVQTGGKEEGAGGKEREKRYESSIGVGSDPYREYIDRTPEAHILARGVNTIPQYQTRNCIDFMQMS
eukprot:6176667-Pleurochrysis_carterae.AAC.4